MKQIIVNVGGLTIEEKQRVNEALAKIKNISKISNLTPEKVWLYAPSEHGPYIGWDSIRESETPTHTSQQVLEMAGMTPSEISSLVYEPKQKGHVHAELMALYAEDAKTHAEPWKLWECGALNGDWFECICHPLWVKDREYRRKPKTHTLHGVIPDLRIKPKNGQEYWYPDASIDALVWGTVYGYEQSTDSHRVANNLCYKPTEEGKQAAILHAKAMLGV